MPKLAIATIAVLVLLIATPFVAQASDEVNVSVSVLEKRSDQTINDFDFSQLAMAESGQEEQKVAPHLSLWQKIVRALVSLFT
jgi:hypothetical protein